MVDIETSVEPSINDEGMGHSDSLGFHWMFLGIDKLSEMLIVEVTYPPLALSLHHLF